ncbi:MAG: lamin tail domain-containing protein [Planctomycetota bacterium]
MPCSPPRIVATLVAGMVALSVGSANAQLQITEIMYNPLDEFDFEWIEVRNTGVTPIDLDGAWVDSVGGFYRGVGDPGGDPFNPNIVSSVATNTVVPAGSVAVLWDGFFGTGNENNFNDTIFRDAWNIDPSVPLVGVQFYNRVDNDGAEIGIWASTADYEADIPDVVAGGTSGTVGSTTNALVSVVVEDSAPWPVSTNGVSVTWNGLGGANGFQDGANWELSQDGVRGGTVSNPVGEGQLNGLDGGSPGAILNGTAGAAPGSVTITEVMYNPASPEDDWEWIEIYNNTGATLDFGANPAILDDDDGAVATEGNITSGTIPNGEFGVLYNAEDLDEVTFTAAWGTGFNPIAVNDWPGFSNTADRVSFWSDFDNYTARDETTADDTLLYDDGVLVGEDPEPEFFPTEDGASSIGLTAIGSDNTDGANWALSNPLPPIAGGDGVSFDSLPIFGGGSIYAGGDLGSAGVFEELVPPEGDYNGDGTVDAADYTVWRDAFAAGDVLTVGKAVPGVADLADYGVWKAAFIGAGSGASTLVPEPAAAALLLPLLGLATRRRIAG